MRIILAGLFTLLSIAAHASPLEFVWFRITAGVTEDGVGRGDSSSSVLTGTNVIVSEGNNQAEADLGSLSGVNFLSGNLSARAFAESQGTNDARAGSTLELQLRVVGGDLLLPVGFFSTSYDGTFSRSVGVTNPLEGSFAGNTIGLSMNVIGGGMRRGISVRGTAASSSVFPFVGLDAPDLTDTPGLEGVVDLSGFDVSYKVPTLFFAEGDLIEVSVGLNIGARAAPTGNSTALTDGSQTAAFRIQLMDGITISGLPDGTDFVLSETATIPLPAPALLLLTGVGALGGVRRVRRKIR